MYEKGDLGHVVLVHDRPGYMVTGDDVLDEPFYRRSAQLGGEWKRRAVKERVDGVRC